MALTCCTLKTLRETQNNEKARMSDEQMQNPTNGDGNNGDDNKMTDAVQQPEPQEKTGTGTTYDVSSEAETALRMFQETQERKRTSIGSTHIEGEDVILKVEVQGGGTPLLLSLNDEVVVGRRDPTTKVSPDLDLTPYGGYQMGISRRHAIMNLMNGNLVITDMGSSNGTFVNGQRLEARKPEPIRDGDLLRLGQIIMTIKFVDVSKGAS